MNLCARPMFSSVRFLKQGILANYFYCGTLVVNDSGVYLPVRYHFTLLRDAAAKLIRITAITPRKEELLEEIR